MLQLSYNLYSSGFLYIYLYSRDFLDGSRKNLPDVDSIPGLEKTPGEGNGNPLWYSCLENPRGAWWATVHRVAKSQTQLNTHTYVHHSTIYNSQDTEVSVHREI